jgi:hypothetical protein
MAKGNVLEDGLFHQDTHPIAMIPDIGIPDGTYHGLWINDVVTLAHGPEALWGIYEITDSNKSGTPIIVTINVKSGHGFVWLKES